MSRRKINVSLPNLTLRFYFSQPLVQRLFKADTVAIVKFKRFFEIFLLYPAAKAMRIQIVLGLGSGVDEIGYIAH